jgi:hypothetical protein
VKEVDLHAQLVAVVKSRGATLECIQGSPRGPLDLVRGRQGGRSGRSGNPARNSLRCSTEHLFMGFHIFTARTNDAGGPPLLEEPIAGGEVVLGEAAW